MDPASSKAIILSLLRTQQPQWGPVFHEVSPASDPSGDPGRPSSLADGPQAYQFSPFLFPLPPSLPPSLSGRGIACVFCGPQLAAALRQPLQALLGSCAVGQFHWLQSLLLICGLLTGGHVFDYITMTFMFMGPDNFKRQGTLKCEHA